jgi:hypothetical protein
MGDFVSWEWYRLDLFARGGGWSSNLVIMWVTNTLDSLTLDWNPTSPRWGMS